MEAIGIVCALYGDFIGVMGVRWGQFRNHKGVVRGYKGLGGALRLKPFAIESVVDCCAQHAGTQRLKP